MITRHETSKKVHTLIKGKKLDSSILASINEVLPSDFLVVDPITDAISGSCDYKNVGDLNLTRKRVSKVLKSINVSTQDIPGSRANKHKGKRHAITMIRETGNVDIFHTVSSAEYHWPEQQRLINQRMDLDRFGNIQPNSFNLPTFETIASYPERVTRCQLHPVEKVYCFRQRLKSYYDHVVFPKDGKPGIFGLVSSYFAEPENHKRGAFHSHSLISLQYKPSVLDPLSAEFWDKRVTAFVPKIYENDPRIYKDWIPDKAYLDHEHPCIRRWNINDSLDAIKNDLSDLMLTLQLHRKCSNYCLRKGKCRFNAPWNVTDVPFIDGVSTNSKEGFNDSKCCFQPRRNHSLVSNFTFGPN
jgi:hypothetical protein